MVPPNAVSGGIDSSPDRRPMLIAVMSIQHQDWRFVVQSWR
jgi:hypothetical protein